MSKPRPKRVTKTIPRRRKPIDWIVTVQLTLTDPSGGVERRRVELQTRMSEWNTTDRKSAIMTGAEVIVAMLEEFPKATAKPSRDRGAGGGLSNTPLQNASR